MQVGIDEGSAKQAGKSERRPRADLRHCLCASRWLIQACAPRRGNRRARGKADNSILHRADGAWRQQIAEHPRALGRVEQIGGDQTVSGLSANQFECDGQPVIREPRSGGPGNVLVHDGYLVHCDDALWCRCHHTS